MLYFFAVLTVLVKYERIFGICKLETTFFVAFYSSVIILLIWPHGFAIPIHMAFSDQFIQLFFIFLIFLFCTMTTKCTIN